MDDIQERLSRYGRLLENEDFKKTIKELDAAFQIDGSVFVACNCPNATEYLFAREGMRTYRNTLLDLERLTLEQMNQNQEGEVDE